MSSTFSTKKRHTFLRRKYCFLVASALSPPVGRCEALMGRPPLDSAMVSSSYSFSTGVGAPGMGAPGRGAGSAAPAMACSMDGELGAANGSAGLGSAGRWCRLGGACHGMFHGWRAGRGYRSRGFACRALIARLLALLDFLQFLVDAHGDKLHHLIRYTELAFQFLYGFGLGCKLQQDVKTLAALLHAIGEFANAPFV